MKSKKELLNLIFMRKSTKIAVVLAAAALLVAGFAFTTLAKGWVKEAEGLYYYEDEYGMKVYNEWKKDGANYYYLGDDGYMVANKLVWDNDGYHWCGADGARVANQWIQVPASEEDQNDLEVEYRWYRFNAKGVAVTGKQTVEGKTYFFDADGKMLYGYVQYDGAVKGWTTKTKDAMESTEPTYFCGTNEEGWALKSEWKQVEYDKSGDSWEDSSKAWVFFKSNGLRATSDNSEYGVAWKGQKYYFNEFGEMKNGWEVGSANTPARYFGGEDDGKMVKKGWVYTKPKKGGDDKFWFYFDNAGNAVDKACVKGINGKYYAFAAVKSDDQMQASRMLAGMVKVTTAGTLVEASAVEKVADIDKTTLADWLAEARENVYYFSGDEANDGSLKKNVTFTVDFADDTYTLAVDAQGKLKNYYDSKAKKYYKNGYLLKASEDMRYEMVEIWTAADASKKVLLSSNGAVVGKNTTVADADGNYFWVNADATKTYKATADLPSAAKVIGEYKKGKKEVTVDGVVYVINDTKDGADGTIELTVTVKPAV